MRRLLTVMNFIAAFVVIIWAIEHYAIPKFVLATNADRYKDLMFKCDHVMREHFIAKQMVHAAPNEETIRNLESSEIGLISCHDYDKLRKSLMSWGVSENQIAAVGLNAIEEKASDIRKFVEIHEIRY